MLVYRFFKVEWTVCAKYTHGGSVKGMVKSNFRFVKKWHVSKWQILQIWTKKCETFFLVSSQYSQGWRRPPVLKSITAETTVTADE